MRSRPRSWTKTLASLGFRRRLVKRRRGREPGRLSRIESLEARQMLALTVETLADVVDPGDGVRSLREAIAQVSSQESTIDCHESLHGGRILLTGGSRSRLFNAVISLGQGLDNVTGI